VGVDENADMGDDGLAELVARYGPLVKAEAVARLLDCHVDTVYKLEAAGLINGICLKGRPQKRRGRKGLRIFLRSVFEYLADRITESTRATRPVEEEQPAPAMAQPASKVKARTTKVEILLPFSKKRGGPSALFTCRPTAAATRRPGIDQKRSPSLATFHVA
jgi:hypothetical protein